MLSDIIIPQFANIVCMQMSGKKQPSKKTSVKGQGEGQVRVRIRFRTQEEILHVHNSMQLKQIGESKM